MSFYDRLAPASEECIFSEEGYFVWCGSIFKHKDFYYMVYSRWEKELGFEAWVSDSKLCLAKSDSLFGKFEHFRVLGLYERFDGDKLCMHNPTVLKKDGRIFLYYMMNHGNGDWWQHRNRQRIGIAYADDPEGIWTWDETPVLDVSDKGIDSLMVSNPTVLEKENGNILMVYKAVSKDGEMPVGGEVICGVAESPSPYGVFKKYGKPIFRNPENAWSVEDPYIFREGGRYFALAKDFQGYFTGTGSMSTALFVSDDGYNWSSADEPLAYENKIKFEDGELSVHRLERPQIYFEDGAPRALVCAVMPNSDKSESYNIRIPIKC